MYNAQIVVNKIRELSENKKTSINKMLAECELGKDLISDMQRKGHILTGDKLGIIADYLEVSVDYLLGRTDKPEVNK